MIELDKDELISWYKGLFENCSKNFQSLAGTHRDTLEKLDAIRKIVEEVYSQPMSSKITEEDSWVDSKTASRTINAIIDIKEVLGDE